MDLIFGEKRYRPYIRMLYDIKECVYCKDWLRQAENVPLYYMYKDISLTEDDKKKILANDLRYDITIIPPRSLGSEYVKTAGHYHPINQKNNQKKGLSYTEVYEVIDGKAHFLFQKGIDNLEDVVLIEAERGDKVIIPPGYGHITINPSKNVLKMANWVSRNFSAIYDPIKKMGGGAYYEMIDGIIQNENYGKVPELRIIEPKEYPEFGLTKKTGLYRLIDDLELLKFLNYPEYFEEIWLNFF
ncbi:MAG TPA: glucose-6-phosphate isomerase [Halobacteria archaeon]|nr:glucose-6-phosphate isomerase [Halobacteria archaeon]